MYCIMSNEVINGGQKATVISQLITIGAWQHLSFIYEGGQSRPTLLQGMSRHPELPPSQPYSELKP